MLEIIFKDAKEMYLSLPLHARINTKYIEFRALANCIAVDTGETYLQEFLPSTDRV